MEAVRDACLCRLQIDIRRVVVQHVDGPVAGRSPVAGQLFRDRGRPGKFHSAAAFRILRRLFLTALFLLCH